jgi:phosphopantothenoylcysteine decarboxylase / phosphopantothenate---cysteine ligase
MLNGKNIIVGVSASIAAYKSAILIRLLVKSGANVKVIMTPASKDFITPLTLSTLSKNPVFIEFSKENEEWNNHVDLGLWADMMIIAPASANTIAKMANGICDNFLLATYLSATCPIYYAPAMDLDMYRHPSTLSNISRLKDFGNLMIQPGTGELASGLYGEGRMAEPEEILDFIVAELGKKLPLRNKTAIVTAGPTYEAIDPVRFIGNHSSGKMGFALAEELASQGAKVKLICGPNHLTVNHPNIQRTDVVSSEEMFSAVTSAFEGADICIMSAAVADYAPEKAMEQKIKKSSGTTTLELKKTKDILSYLGTIKSQKQILVGFALETENEEVNAKQKLKGKNLDFIVLNSLNDKGAGFKTETNRITIIDKDNKIEKFELKSKKEVARDIVKKIISFSENA